MQKIKKYEGEKCFKDFYAFWRLSAVFVVRCKIVIFDEEKKTEPSKNHQCLYGNAMIKVPIKSPLSSNLQQYENECVKLSQKE